tara:strand:- start:66 stop:701 length:636 start_codon:yes stop_codon:yes gene_type:complete
MFTQTDISQELNKVRAVDHAPFTSSTLNNFNLDKLESDRIYHISQIKKTCIDFRLRFLDATLFKGSFPVEAVSQIKSIEAKHDTVLSDLKIMAPSKLFKLENADDPLLFAPMGNGYYYLIHQWGDDLHPFRKAMVWPFKNIITACISLLVFSFFLSFFVPLSLFTPNPTTSDFIMIYFFMFKAIAAIVIYYTFARGKNFNRAIWNSKYYNS